MTDDDFRSLFNGRPIAMATFSGGGGMELLVSLRIQLTHLGAQVVGRQLLSNHAKPAHDDSINDLVQRLPQMQTPPAPTIFRSLALPARQRSE